MYVTCRGVEPTEFDERVITSSNNRTEANGDKININHLLNCFFLPDENFSRARRGPVLHEKRIWEGEFWTGFPGHGSPGWDRRKEMNGRERRNAQNQVNIS